MVQVLFRDFCQETTAHGFLRIGDPDRKLCARLLWLGIMLGFTGVFIWQIKLLIDKYMEFGTTVNTKLSVETKLTFPTVTLCNLNPYQKEKLPNQSHIARYLNLFDSAMNMTYLTEMSSICNSNDSVAMLLCGNMSTDSSSENTTSSSQGTSTTASSLSTSSATKTPAQSSAGASTNAPGRQKRQGPPMGQAGGMQGGSGPGPSAGGQPPNSGQALSVSTGSSVNQKQQQSSLSVSQENSQSAISGQSQPSTTSGQSHQPTTPGATNDNKSQAASPQQQVQNAPSDSKPQGQAGPVAQQIPGQTSGGQGQGGPPNVQGGQQGPPAGGSSHDASGGQAGAGGAGGPPGGAGHGQGGADPGGLAQRQDMQGGQGGANQGPPDLGAPGQGAPPDVHSPDGQGGGRGPKVSWLSMENKAFKDIGTLAAINRSEYSDALQSQSDFIEDCQFNLATCQGIKKYDHPWYGVCYTFNPLGNYTSVRPGPLYGLALQLHVNSNQYLSSVYMRGVRIGVNQAYRTPFPEIDGVFATVGASTAIGVSVTHTDRLGSPYGDCLADPSSLSNSNQFRYASNYTPSGCMNTCLQSRIVQNCRCWSFAYPQPPDDTVPLCASASHSQCATNQEMAMVDNCTCPQVCNDTQYKLTVSQSLWPAQQHNRCPPGAPCAGDTSTYAKENELKVLIYFESLTKYTYTESEAYAFLSLISDFGGQLGLWVGASFCTVVEVISFFFSLLVVCMGCNQHHVNVEKHPEQKPTKQRPSVAPGNVTPHRPIAPIMPPKQAVYPPVKDYYG